MRALGVDLGASRIGLALSDPSGTLATPAGVVVRSRDRADDHAALARKVTEESVDVVVVGLPLSLSGDDGPAARSVREELRQLQAVLDVPVRTQDERFSTVTATRSLREAGRGRAVKADRRRAGAVDEAAAAVLLQSWLDAQRRPAGSRER